MPSKFILKAIQKTMRTAAASSGKQMAGFGILAAVALAIIAVAAVMITRLAPAGSAPLAKGKGGRANSKKRV